MSCLFIIDSGTFSELGKKEKHNLRLRTPFRLFEAFLGKETEDGRKQVSLVLYVEIVSFMGSCHEP